MPKTRKLLNAREQSFVELMALGTLSATQAFIQAGYSQTGANSASSRMLAKVRIKEAVVARKSLLEHQFPAANPDFEMPTTEFVMLGLVREASIGDLQAPSAARVSALGKLGDYMGLDRGSQNKLSEGFVELLGALGRGFRAETALNEAKTAPNTLSEPPEEATEASAGSYRLLEDSDGE